MKPRVRYIDLARPLSVGNAARLIPLDHPNLEVNHQWILTSPVQRFMELSRGPIIETRNTIYHPAGCDESAPEYLTRETVK